MIEVGRMKAVVRRGQRDDDQQQKVTNIELAQMGDADWGTRVKRLFTLRALSLSRTASVARPSNPPSAGASFSGRAMLSIPAGEA